MGFLIDEREQTWRAAYLTKEGSPAPTDDMDHAEQVAWDAYQDLKDDLDLCRLPGCREGGQGVAWCQQHEPEESGS